MKLLPLCPCAIRALLVYFNLSFSSRYSCINRLIKSNYSFNFFILNKYKITYIRIMKLLRENIIFQRSTFCLRFTKVSIYAVNPRQDLEDVLVAVEGRCHLHFDCVHRLRWLTLSRKFLFYRGYISNITVFVKIQMRVKPVTFRFLNLLSLLLLASVKPIITQKTSFVRLVIDQYSRPLRFNLYFLLDLTKLDNASPIFCIFTRIPSLFLMRSCFSPASHAIF